MKLALFHHLSEKDQFSRPRFGKHRQRRLVLEKIRKRRRRVKDRIRRLSRRTNR